MRRFCRKSGSDSALCQNEFYTYRQNFALSSDMGPARKNYTAGSGSFSQIQRPALVVAAKAGVFRAGARKNPLHIFGIEKIEFYFLHTLLLT